MSGPKLIASIAVVAIVAALFALGFMSGHARAALHAIQVTHGLMIIWKVALVVLSVVGVVVVRVYKALRPTDASEGRTGARSVR